MFVDYNDQVKKGQLLAQLNTDKINAQVLQTKAALAVAKAGVIEAQATLEESDAQLKRLEHVRKLTNGKLPSQADFISAEAAEKRAIAAKKHSYRKSRTGSSKPRSKPDRLIQDQNHFTD